MIIVILFLLIVFGALGGLWAHAMHWGIRSIEKADVSKEMKQAMYYSLFSRK